MATIFCFTSTGGSLYAAKTIMQKIDGKVLPMNENTAICDDNVIGFVFPVYFWGLPRIVARFVSNMQISNKNAYVFAVAVSGGPVFGVLGMLKKLLKQKGIKLQYGARLISVSNYIPNYRSVNDGEKLRKRTDENILKIADAIKNKKTNRVHSFTVLNRLAYKTYPNENSDRYFSIADTCTGCMICQKICPVKNIIIKSGKPEFKHKCEHCLACLHNCPVHAIDWKHKTEGKQQYRNANITLEELISFSNNNK